LVRGQRKRIPSLPKKELPVAANTTKYRERPMEKTNDGSDFAIFSEILNPSHAIPAAKSPATRMYIGAFNPTFAKVYKPMPAPMPAPCPRV
jgi:hypothetical protein